MLKNRLVKRLIIIFQALLFSGILTGQDIVFRFDKTPVKSGFKMEGYWVWGGSVVKVGSTYHLFASRWEKTGPFPEGYRQNSEIVRASSKSAEGPYIFEEVVIGERDSAYWDSNMAHNPTIHKIGDEYVLFYIGSDFTTKNKKTGTLLRRVGYASSKSVYGPWTRSDKPVINYESNNPAILVEEDKVKLIYRDSELKVYIAESVNYKGPYKTLIDNLWPECKLEDFYIFRLKGQYHLICEDNTGGVSGHIRWGVHLFSSDGITGWKKYNPVIVYDHDIVLNNDSVLNCIRRERPQLLIESNKITYLLNGVYDGKDSWCQPVRLKSPIRIDQVNQFRVK